MTTPSSALTTTTEKRKMNEKNDCETKNHELRTGAELGSMSCASDMAYGMGELAKLAADYGAALDEMGIRTGQRLWAVFKASSCFLVDEEPA